VVARVSTTVQTGLSFEIRIETGLWVGALKNRGLIPGSDKKYFSSQMIPDRLELSTYRPIQHLRGGFSLGVKWRGSEVKHSPTFSVEASTRKTFPFFSDRS
jgi:hypothetical protein